jgi:hypothetical protein
VEETNMRQNPSRPPSREWEKTNNKRQRPARVMFITFVFDGSNVEELSIEIEEKMTKRGI